jgi:ribosomal protein S27AE
MIFDEPLDGVPADRSLARLCPLCEAGCLVARQCKLICESCGYVESSEDNFVPNIANPPHSIARERSLTG